jgi:hypothetical protein
MLVQYRNESILKPVVLEPLLSVPSLPRQFNRMRN